MIHRSQNKQKIKNASNATTATSSSSSENISDRLQSATVRTRSSQKSDSSSKNPSKKSSGVKNLVSAFNKASVSVNHNNMNSISSTGSSGVNSNQNNNNFSLSPHTTTFHSRSGSTPENTKNTVPIRHSPKNHLKSTPFFGNSLSQS